MSEPLEVAVRDSGPVRIAVRTALIMLVFTLVFTALMAGTYSATAPLVAASAQKEKLALIGEVLPAASYDNALLDDWVEVLPIKELGVTDTTRLYRARKDGQPVVKLNKPMAAINIATDELIRTIFISGDKPVNAARNNSIAPLRGLMDKIYFRFG